ncbi:MAG: lytic murein transglycosylase, partial [Pseudomonadota bacterium]
MQRFWSPFFASLFWVFPAFASPDPALADEADSSTFEDFRESFRIDALAAGVSLETYDREMATVIPLPIVVKRNDNQPEFSRPLWGYLDSAVSDRRIADGRQYQTQAQAALIDAEEKYGVNRYILAAIWGLESSYGNIQGSHDVLSALSTLAYQGRRQKYGRAQLLGALQILDRGYATREQLKGSWAGAMGQTQFIPTTYIQYAIDENEDGKRDLWSDHADIFASTANYLAQSGYQQGTPWGFEVLLPEGFDYALADLKMKKGVADWLSLGLQAADGPLSEKVDLNARASVLVPTGAKGPAFMVFENYRAILKYNNSTAYALGIGMLSEALAGTSVSLQQPWPRGDRPLSRDEREQLQQALLDKGYAPGPIDGIIGAGTKAALRAWQRDQNMPADGYAS